ncbi:MAG: response regulator [Desulfamplus sp.]|nr:response regulator [Desulfamplus sp.]
MDNRLLIVDDDSDVLESLSDLLQDEGFNVKAVSCGEDALKEFPDFKPAVIITDMLMPGMNGIDLLREIRKISVHVQIIIMTGYASIKNVTEAMSNNGAFAYFQKPIMDFKILFGTVRQAFEKEWLLRENYHWDERLKTANARFETIFENMDAIIYVADIETYELIYANSKFKKMFGYDHKHGLKCWKILNRQNSWPCNFCTNAKLVDKQGKPLDPYTWEFYNPNVKRRFSIKDQAVYWHDGRVVKLEIAMDITQHYQLSRELEKSRRFQAIGVLAGGIAHDLNNTLAAILGNINLAQLISSDPASEEYFVAAENGIMQAKTLSGKLLALARGDNPIKSKVDMRELLINFIKDNISGSEVIFTPPDESINFNIDADYDQIRTVLSNIFLNASEAMDMKGSIKVDLRRQNNTIKNAEYVVTSIQDTGKGIPASDIEKIFDPYFSSKFHGQEKGTGLGLSIAYSIIKKHGGHIDIDSVEGEGTKVDICIPALSF